MGEGYRTHLVLCVHQKTILVSKYWIMLNSSVEEQLWSMIFAKLHEVVLLMVVLSILILLYWYLLYMTFLKKLYLIVRNTFHCLIIIWALDVLNAHKCTSVIHHKHYRFNNCIYSELPPCNVLIRNLFQLEVFYICSLRIVHVDKQKSLQIS